MFFFCFGSRKKKIHTFKIRVEEGIITSIRVNQSKKNMSVQIRGSNDFGALNLGLTESMIPPFVQDLEGKDGGLASSELYSNISDRIHITNPDSLGLTLGEQESVILSQLKGNVIILEGTIGAGKSKRFTQMKEKLESMGHSVIGVAEEIPTFLDDYIRDPCRFGLLFQITILRTRTEKMILAFRQMVENIKNGIPTTLILDRMCLQGDAIFAKANHIMGYITNDGLRAYYQQFRMEYDYLRNEHEKHLLPLGVKLITLFINVSFGESIKRLKARAKEMGTAEGEYNLDYLATLHGEYSGTFKNTPNRKYNIIRSLNSSQLMDKSKREIDEVIWNYFIRSLYQDAIDTTISI